MRTDKPTRPNDGDHPTPKAATAVTICVWLLSTPGTATQWQRFDRARRRDRADATGLVSPEVIDLFWDISPSDLRPGPGPAESYLKEFGTVTLVSRTKARCRRSRKDDWEN